MPTPPIDEVPERPITPLAAALWAVSLTTLWMVAVSLTEAARPGAEADIINLSACQVLATSVVIFAMVRWHARDASLRLTMGLRPIGALQVPLAVAAGAGVVPLFSTIDDAVLKRWPMGDDAAAEGMQKLLASSSHLGLVVAALVVVPVARELFYRGILYRGLRAAAGMRSATLVTTVLYACSYLDPRQMPTALALGAALAWLRERTGTVVAPIVAQLAFGAVEGIPILLGRDPNADVTYAPRWVVGGAIIALLALVAVGTGTAEDG